MILYFGWVPLFPSYPDPVIIIIIIIIIIYSLRVFHIFHGSLSDSLLVSRTLLRNSGRSQ